MAILKVIIVVMLLFAIVCESLQCSTIQTAGGTQEPETCVFPFKYRAKIYFGCTMDHGTNAWCAVQVNSEGFYEDGSKRWGHCNVHCLKKGFVSRGAPLPTTTPLTTATTRPIATKMPTTKRRMTKTATTTTAASESATTASTLFGKSSCKTASYRSLFRASTDGSSLPVEGDSFECGLSRLLPEHSFSLRIIGGLEADLQEFPFAVLLVYRNPDSRTGFQDIFGCGGTLINRRYVLTAAHCTVKLKPSKIRIGEYDVTKACDCENEICAPIPQTIIIEHIIMESRFRNRRPYEHDIALIRLAEPAVLNPAVAVVCLPGVDRPSPFQKPMTGQYGTVVGWGKTDAYSNGRLEDIGAHSSVIQKVEIPFINDTRCGKLLSGIVRPGQICAGSFNADSCNGDSGGPLPRRLDESSPWYLVGIVSFGTTKCGTGGAAVYTFVENYIDWIIDNIKP